MPLVIRAAVKMNKGQFYKGLIPRGNAFRVDEDVRVSVNKSAFVKFTTGVDYYTHDTFSYIFATDVLISSSQVDPVDLELVQIASSSNDYTLGGTGNEVIDDLVTLTLTESANTASILCEFYGELQYSPDSVEMTIRHDNKTLATVEMVWEDLEVQNLFSVTLEGEENFNVGDEITFDVANLSTNGNLEIMGSTRPSLIRFEALT